MSTRQPTSSIASAKDWGETGDHREAQSVLEREADELAILVTGSRERLHTLASERLPQGINNLLALINDIIPVVRSLASSSEASSKDLRVLRGLFQRLNGEVQGIQQSTLWVFIQLDQDLTGFIRNLSRLKTKVSLYDPLLGSTEELTPVKLLERFHGCFVCMISS